MGCFCLNPQDAWRWRLRVTWVGLVVQIKKYEKLETEEERLARSREVFDTYIMRELLACSHVSAPARWSSGQTHVPARSGLGVGMG